MDLKQFLYDILSWVLSIPDLLFSLFNSFPLFPKFYCDGFGDTMAYTKRRNQMLASLEDGSYEQEYGLNNNQKNGNRVEVVETHRTNGIVFSKGQFKSPLEHLLHPEGRTCHFRLVQPEDVTTKTKDNVYIILYPATGEMGCIACMAMAKKLAITHGWSCIVPTMAFYDERKPANQSLWFVRDVSTMLLGFQANIEECMLLTSWIHNREKDAVVCHSGFSAGAILGCYSASACLSMGLDGSRIACASYSSSVTPSAIVDGALNSSLDWSAIEATASQPGQLEAQQELYNLLNDTQLSLYKPPQNNNNNKLAVVRGMSFSNDDILRPVYSRALMSQLESISASKVHNQWLPGGHSVAGIARLYFQRRLIEDTVKELILSRRTPKETGWQVPQ